MPRSPGLLPVELTEAKLFRPGTRPGVVPRPELLARLAAARDAPTVSVVAPAGYGKTTLLALWAAADDRPFAWLSLDRHDDDPIVLLTHLAVALDRVVPLPPGVFSALRTAGVSVPATVAPRLGAALARSPRPLVLVLDDVHVLGDGPSLDALVTLVRHLRGTVQFALVGRGMPVPLARARAEGRVAEIGTRDLAFTQQGARSLLRAAGADLPDPRVAELTRRTEGWPAGLYLAALAGTRDAGGGDDRLAAEYLQAELLARLPAPDVDFLVRTSVLDRLSGPLCDAVLETTGSRARLARLQAANLFLVPLDGAGEEYRYHALFRGLLRSHLDPGTARELLRRAAAACQAAGRLEDALHHAQDAGDVDRMAQLTVALSQPLYAAGRSATAMGWLEELGQRGAVERYPAVGAIGAYLCALTGRPAAADRWLDLVDRRVARDPASVDDGAAMWLTVVRALMCRSGIEQMQQDAEAASLPGAGSAADTEYPVRLFLGGVARMLGGDADGAEARFADALELIDETRRAPLFCSVLAHQALLRLDRGDWAGAEPLVARALATARLRHTTSHVTNAPVVALAARMAVHRGDVATARDHLAEAQRLRPLLSHAVPWAAVEVLLQMAEVAIGLGDPQGARQFVRDAESVLRRRPGLGVLGSRSEELRDRLARLPVAESATLTAAELRLLPLLLTHLTLTGIAGRLFLSPHTVKSQLSATYRKLGVHSRSEAVSRARDLGLLAP
ncbi:LuxR C-terminal-related transcriptional regulator [Blastococcus sp. URHD0036]|uniref:LuxR C-terminal-related transcriptional regulator n=1 Tax=Blastococcus sp. URHD0036 TaxID=1380356 RepID=UPI000494E9BB|nr:LuxR C-terminal-related transcriptional regulator [Blastococcus sp. URHD0036]